MTSQTFISRVTDDSWMRGLHPGHLVELHVYGQKMIGKVTRIGQDNITIRMPIEDQSGDVRRFSVTGTAIVSIDGAAARVPVSGQSTGEYVALQFIGPVEIIQRRLHIRVQFAAPIRLKWRAEPGGAWVEAESFTQDLSEGGTRVQAARTVWPGLGEDVRVEIDLPTGTVVENAKVIGKTPDYDLRLAFTQVNQLTVNAIKSLV